MIRIKFASDKDRIDGNYVLMTHTVSRRLRGDIFEIDDDDRKLLDEHQLHYTVLPLDADGSVQEVGTPPPYEAQRRNGI
ncbi:MAG: hypothetical protein L0Y72_03150 [Gemmataceae bacterium]|nr:hypothetical protein [Gemmataceae bacterium]MCI0738015.1 hypothetical protein [Gemmataceae bacterium]